MTDEQYKKKNIEANWFAMSLLMPAKQLREEAKGIDLSKEDPRIQELADKYQVPLNVMICRLYDLYLTAT